MPAPRESPNTSIVNVLRGIVAGERRVRVLTAKAKARGVPFDEVEMSAFAATSIKQHVSAEQFADYVVYLASPRAPTISGQALSVCGDTNMLSCGRARPPCAGRATHGDAAIAWAWACNGSAWPTGSDCPQCDGQWPHGRAK